MIVSSAVLSNPAKLLKIGLIAKGTGNREQGTGNREQGTGNSEQGTVNSEDKLYVAEQKFLEEFYSTPHHS